MRLFLVLAGERHRTLVHGVDYLKGLVDADERVVRECGRAHEFQTRQCHPVFLTEDEVREYGYKDDEVVEIVPMHEQIIDRMTQMEVEA